MQYIELHSKQHRHASAGVLLGSTITFAIMYSPQPLISMFSRQYGITPDVAGLSISFTTIALAISLFFVSMFAGVLPRKRVMCVSLIVTSCLAIVTSFTQHFGLFLFFRFLEGVSVACFPSIAMAYLTEEFAPRDLGRVMGYYVAGNAVGGLAGRILIGVLTDLSNWHTAFLIQGAVSLLGALWFLFFLPESKNFKKTDISVRTSLSGLKEALLHKKLIFLYLTGFLLMGAYITVLNYIGYPLTRAPYNLSQTVFGFIFIVNLFGVYSSVLFGRLADRHSRRSVIAIAFAVLFAGAVLTLAPPLALRILGVAAVAFGFMAAHSVASSWIGLLAKRDLKGQASSFYLLFYYVGSSLFGWLGGFVVHGFGWNGIVLYTCLLIAAAVLAACRPWEIAVRTRKAR